MTNEERLTIYNSFHKGVQMMLEKMEKMGREKPDWSLCEMGQLSDIMKDLSETEKNLTKANYYSMEHSEERY